MAQNNDSPGKRLKREEAKSTLYVSRPDDPRLQMYRDSLEAAVPAILANKQIRYMNTLPMPKRRDYYENVFFEVGNEKQDKRFKPPMSSYAAISRLEQANKKPYGIEANKNVKTTIEPEKGYSYGWDTPGDSRKFSALTELGVVEHLPKRKVVFRPEEPIELLAPRQAPSPILTREEIIAPVPRPVDVPPAPPMREPVMEEEVVTERPMARKPPKAVMPRRAGGWSNQPLLMQLFPKLYQR